MSGHINAAGWYLSTTRELKNASLPSVIAEDIHNVEHYQSANPNAPPAKFLFGSCLLIRKGKKTEPVFFRASNMPHTADIFERKLTAFAKKNGESMVATHGYGAVLPPMYIAGIYKNQFFDHGEDAWKEIQFDIGKKEEECETDEFKAFPLNPVEVLVKPDIEETLIWTEEVVRLFQEHDICTIEWHRNPTFKGHEDLRDKKQFLNFLQALQSQFEEIICTGAVEIAGVFVDDNQKSTIYPFPYNFYKELHNPNTLAFPISPYGITELEEFVDFNVTYTDTSTHCCVQLSTGPVWFEIKEKTGQIEPLTPIPDIAPRMVVRIGKIKEHTRLYAECIAADCDHPLHLPNLQSFADGLYLDLGDYRMTKQPLSGVLPRSQYLPYLASTRVLVKVCDEDTKRRYIDARARKDLSTLKTGNGNRIKNVADALVKLMTRAVKSGKPIEDGIRDAVIKAPAVRRTRLRTAANDGNAYETNCLDILREYFSSDDTIKVHGNDVAIRRTILETDDKQFTGIDIFLETNGICIAIQCKRKDRVVSSDYESFIRTLRYAREKRSSDYVHGLFVVQKMPEMNANLIELFQTPSADLAVISDNNLESIVSCVRNVLAYYTTPTE
jgi:hypothetical protein